MDHVKRIALSTLQRDLRLAAGACDCEARTQDVEVEKSSEAAEWPDSGGGRIPRWWPDGGRVGDGVHGRHNIIGGTVVRLGSKGYKE
jgi:hypothetical protein